MQRRQHAIFPFAWIFLVIAILDLIGVLWFENIRFVTKPLIVISLMIYYYRSAPKINWLFLSALGFAWLGDCFLMFDGFFLFGLSAFLLMQILYAIVFSRKLGSTNILKIGLSLLVIIASAYSFWNLYPYIMGMTIPVLVYSLSICVMVLMGLWRKENSDGYWWILFGVLCFLISDGVLAFNKFLEPIPLGGFLVMLTYISAQYLIVNGYLKYQLETESSSNIASK